MDEGKTPCYTHLVSVDLGLHTVDVMCMAFGDGGLFLALADGRVVLYRCSQGGSLHEGPQFCCEWQVSDLHGMPTVLTIGLPEAGVCVVGTERGGVVQVGPDEVRCLSAHDAAVTALILEPLSDGLRVTQRGHQALFFADVSGRLYRIWLGEAASPELCMELHASVLSMEFSERTDRLLISTSERIAIVEGAFEDLGNSLRLLWVGSKPHRGQYTATFSRASGPLGPGTLIAARPGGRLWVAEAASGTVQTTLKFHDTDKAALNRLVTVDAARALSWSREDSASMVTLLDLDVIAVSKQWPLPAIVSVARCGEGLVFAHHRSLSILVSSTSLPEFLRALFGRGPRLSQDTTFLLDCIGQALLLRGQLETLSASAIITLLEPLIGTLSGANVCDDRVKDFKLWVSELEDDEIRVLGQHVCLSMPAPLNNFPVAGGLDLSPVLAHTSVLDRCPAAKNRPPRAGARCISPRRLRLCRRTQRRAERAFSIANTEIATSGALTVPSSVSRPPLPDGTVAVALGRLPFHTSTVVCQYFTEVLTWLSTWLLGSPDTRAMTSEGVQAASFAFELLCLHQSPAQSRGQSAWPGLGVVAARGAAPSTTSAGSLASALQEVAQASAEGADATQTSPQGDAAAELCAAQPWSACAKHWTASVAVAFCESFLRNAATEPLERCLVLANGLVPAVKGWLVVVQWLQTELGPSPRVHGAMCSQEPGKHPNSGVAGLHAALSFTTARHAGNRAVALASVGDEIFKVASQRFPQVLPWNLGAWIGDAVAGLRCGSRESRNCFLEVFAGEFVQYLLRLVNTCAAWGDIGQLVHGLVRLILHGLPFGDLRPHIARDALVDTLMGQHPEWFTVPLLREMLYPTGLILLFEKDESTARPQRVLTLIDDVFCTIEGARERARVTSTRCPVCGPIRSCAESAALRRFQEKMSPAGALGLSASKRIMEDQNIPPDSCSGVVMESDLELARSLLRICQDSERVHLLDSVSKSDREGERGSSPALQRLLAALTLVAPCREAAAACARTAVGTSDFASAAIVQKLWQTALGASSYQDVLGGCALLPPPRPVPLQPVLPPETLRRSIGFHRLGDHVKISRDGTLARHSDDFGEEMHGVVLSANPLAVGDTGVYFEVEVDEVRSESMPDGLTVGVTTTAPSTLNKVPRTAERIANTWVVGYDGQMWDPVTCSLSPVSWDPRTLEVGDVVGVMVTLSEGELLVFHNGVACCPGPRGIPVTAKPLFAAVDLLGSARAVRWRERSAPADRC